MGGLYAVLHTTDSNCVPQKRQVAKVAERKFPEFFEFSSRILPRIWLRIFPEFFRGFGALLPGRRRPQKNHQRSPPFSMQNSQADSKKESNKTCLESGQTKKTWRLLSFVVSTDFGWKRLPRSRGLCRQSKRLRAIHWYPPSVSAQHWEVQAPLRPSFSKAQNPELSENPNPEYNWEAYCRTGGEVCCSTNGRCIARFPPLQGLEARKAHRHKWGAYCNARCTLEVLCSTFQTSCTGWGFPKI